MKYCKTHNQQYMDHVPECPICKGERSYPAMVNDADYTNTILTYIPPILIEERPDENNS